MACSPRRQIGWPILKRARARRNLRVVTGALVDKVLFEGTRATGVRASVNGTPQDFTASLEVILSAGALMTPQILQRSGVGDPALDDAGGEQPDQTVQLGAGVPE